MLLVYSDRSRSEYRLQDCNGYEIYRIDYKNGMRKYQVYENKPLPNKNPLYEGWDGFPVSEKFYTLKEAREYARTH